MNVYNTFIFILPSLTSLNNMWTAFKNTTRQRIYRLGYQYNLSNVTRYDFIFRYYVIYLCNLFICTLKMTYAPKHVYIY